MRTSSLVHGRNLVVFFAISVPSSVHESVGIVRQKAPLSASSKFFPSQQDCQHQRAPSQAGLYFVTRLLRRGPVRVQRRCRAPLCLAIPVAQFQVLYNRLNMLTPSITIHRTPNEIPAIRATPCLIHMTLLSAVHRSSVIIVLQSNCARWGITGRAGYRHPRASASGAEGAADARRGRAARRPMIQAG
jgi:hypothetical protein